MGEKAERREVLLEGWRLVRREAFPLDSRRVKMWPLQRQAVKVLGFRLVRRSYVGTHS